MKYYVSLITLFFLLITSCSDLEDLEWTNPHDPQATQTIAEICGTAECGEVDGVDCGTCETGLLCGDDNVCYDPCEGKECGEVDGVQCGSCEENWLCGDDNVCYDPCAGKECGEVDGVQCGSCEENWICGEDNVCYDPCEEKECGEVDGVQCGSCESGEVCNENHQCVSCSGDFPHYNARLCWSDQAPDTMDHADAISYCEGRGGHLPTINELRTLIQNCPDTETGGACGVTDECLSYSDCRNDACDGCSSDNSGKYSVFGDTGYFWSSSVRSDNTDRAWFVAFGNGNVYSLSRSHNDYYVRCVR